MKNVLPILCLLLLSCVGDAAEPVEPDTTEAWMPWAASRFTGEDPDWRRAELEAMMWRPDLPYAQKLLDNYALPLDQGGWDGLPVASVETMPVSSTTPPSRQPFVGQKLTVDTAPTTLQGWQELGREVFWRMPMRRDAYIEWVAERPELWDTYGIQKDEEGNARGFVRYRDLRGRVRVAATCAACHGDQGVDGQPNLSLDLGGARAAFLRAFQRPEGAFATWGPGKVDVTDDQVADPVAIPDLWGARHQSYLNASGSIRVNSPASFAVRFETQYIINYAQAERPDRTLIWALATFLQTLEPPTGPEISDDARKRGEETFAQACASCHSPDAGWSGGLIQADLMTSDQDAANSALRGTGSYRAPSLVGLGAHPGPFLHDRSQPTLEALLDSGHPFGGHVEDQDRQDLLLYLSTL